MWQLFWSPVLVTTTTHRAGPRDISLWCE